MRKAFLLTVVVFSLTLLTACDQALPSDAELHDVIQEVWGEAVFLPEHDEYVLSLAFAEFRPTVDEEGNRVADTEYPPVVFWAGYVDEHDESDAYNAHMRAWKDDPTKVMLLEDSYSRKVRIGYYLGRHSMSLYAESEETEINGQPVYYMLRERDGEQFVNIGFQFDHLDYHHSFTITIDEKDSLEDALQFARQVIEHYQEIND